MGQLSSNVCHMEARLELFCELQRADLSMDGC